MRDREAQGDPRPERVPDDVARLAADRAQQGGQVVGDPLDRRPRGIARVRRVGGAPAGAAMTGQVGATVVKPAPRAASASPSSQVRPLPVNPWRSRRAGPAPATRSAQGSPFTSTVRGPLT